ncbi:MAG: hypothetical protein ACRCTJ_06460, partial [Brevinema sp.]
MFKQKITAILLYITMCFLASDIFATQKEIPLKSLTKSVRLQTTFSPFRSSQNVSSDVAIWKNRLGYEQTSYNVSLVGINLNTWLENPEYLNTLQKIANDFPIRNLLTHLQSYNPTLVFNDPDLVKRILETDIYSPYFESIKQTPQIGVKFSDIKSTISYTRHYHIYGVGAQNYPYFGKPVEGGKREINLGLLRDQLSEITVKMPDTDIFLVAVINIVPNWLEETLDIFQVNQQELEILIYAFDRNQKLIGGSGIPLSMLHNGQKFVFEQKIRSKIWQSSLSREFYITPSYQIVNTPKIGTSELTPKITVPIDVTPILNKQQKYILKAIKHLDHQKKSIDVELFNPEGKFLVKPKTRKYPAIELEKKVLVHKDSSLLVQDLSFEKGELLARLNKEGKTAISERSLLLKKRLPSNEGDKLEVLFTQLRESLLSQPSTYTNTPYT